MPACCTAESAEMCWTQSLQPPSSTKTMRKKLFGFFVHMIISLSRCARHRTNSNKTHLPSFTWGTGVCNCWFCWKEGFHRSVRAAAAALCRGWLTWKRFPHTAGRPSETCGWWEEKQELELWGRRRNYHPIFAFQMLHRWQRCRRFRGVPDGSKNQHPAEENTPQPLCLDAQQPDQEKKTFSSF